MGPVLFASAFLTTLVMAAAVSVYQLGFVESAWGPNISFQVLVWMSLVAAFVASVSFGLASALMGRFSSNGRCIVFGAASGLACLGLLYAHNQLFGQVTMPIAFLAVLAPAVLASALGPRQGA